MKTPPPPTITPLTPTYRKLDTDVWVLNTEDIPVPADQIKDVQLVHLGPGSVGGNHRHPRVEWFVAIGDLWFIWLDEGGNRHEELMHPDGQLRLVEVPSHLPHAVVNRSPDTAGVLYEMADGKMEGVEKVEVYGG